MTSRRGAPHWEAEEMMLRSKVWISGLLAIMAASCATGSPDDDGDKPKVDVVHADKNDISPPLSELAKVPVPELFALRAREATPARAIPHMRFQSASAVKDPVVQE